MRSQRNKPFPAAGLGAPGDLRQEPRISQLVERRQVQSALDRPSLPTTPTARPSSSNSPPDHEHRIMIDVKNGPVGGRPARRRGRRCRTRTPVDIPPRLKAPANSMLMNPLAPGRDRAGRVQRVRRPGKGPGHPQHRRHRFGQRGEIGPGRISRRREDQREPGRPLNAANPRWPGPFGQPRRGSAPRPPAPALPVARVVAPGPAAGGVVRPTATSRSPGRGP